MPGSFFFNVVENTLLEELFTALTGLPQGFMTKENNGWELVS